jgi:hypothetical protein
MSEDKKAFTVKDRRHFTADGEARQEDREEGPAPGPRPPLPEPHAEARDGGPEGPISFTAFILSLASQAGMLLSPEEGGPHLAEARQIISILEMLKDKSEGRRTGEEEQALSQVLYELRMAFVAVSRREEP